MLGPVIETALQQFPVVVVTGAGQTGKNTLVQNLPSSAPRSYLSLDDFDIMARAEHFPGSLLEQANQVTLAPPLLFEDSSSKLG